MERIPYIVSMQRSRTTVEGTKPQCQPIDLRCSLRGPLLRREKNKLIERRSGEEGGRGETKVEKSEGVKEGWKGDGEALGEKRKGSRRTSALQKEHSSRKRARKRGTKGAREERADQRAT